MYSQKLFDLLITKNLTIIFAESITGGALSASLVKFPGASNILKDLLSFIVVKPNKRY